MKIRGFELVDMKHMKGDFAELPIRGSQYSAGYDFKCPEDITLHPGEKKLVFTNVKAYMQNGEVLELYIRSSVGVKKGVVLSNGTGVIDSDYCNNDNNDGNIGIPLYNSSNAIVDFKKGERIAQGVFKTFLVSDNCNSGEDRKGGFGSTTDKVCNNCGHQTLLDNHSYWCIKNPEKPISLVNINRTVHNCTEHKLK